MAATNTPVFLEAQSNIRVLENRKNELLHPINLKSKQMVVLVNAHFSLQQVREGRFEQLGSLYSPEYKPVSYCMILVQQKTVFLQLIWR